MSDKTIYLKMDAKVKLSTDVVRVGDLGKIYCEESTIVNKVKTLQIYRIQKSDHNRCVIGVLKVIELIHQEYPTYTIDIVGETESIIERISDKNCVYISSLFFWYYVYDYVLS